MNVDKKARVRLELRQLLFQNLSVCTQINMLSLFERFFDQFDNVRIDQRLAAADADYRRAAFVDGLQTFVNRQHFAHAVFEFPNSTAPGAMQIAQEKRFQHQNQRESFNSLTLTRHDISGHGSC